MLKLFALFLCAQGDDDTSLVLVNVAGISISHPLIKVEVNGRGGIIALSIAVSLYPSSSHIVSSVVILIPYGLLKDN
ncbi:hypothetical protein DKX38_013726 [Salix brachista]|uniref:Uncharacterized protein n=1 Tax=Salix brachista TaxID=2182728 RepID=A0A5N5LDW4_9ROSI|nr:hypothetical protein DKX38_013726 [Salix brachista]